MSDFLINTPSHKRWWLPDRVHTFNSVIYGSSLHQSIWNERSNKLVLSLPVLSLDEPNWLDLSELAQELAKKKFPPRKEAAVREYQRSYRR